MNLPEVPIEEAGAISASTVIIIREVVAELVRRSPATDRAVIEALLEKFAGQADALNADQKPGLEEGITHHLNLQARLMLDMVRKSSADV